MLLGIQIVGTLFGLVLLYLSFVHYKRKEFGIREFGLWSIAWIVFIIMALFPDSLSFAVDTLHLIRTLDFLIITGFMFLIGISFYNYISVKKTMNRLEDLVQKIALNNAEKRIRKGSKR